MLVSGLAGWWLRGLMSPAVEEARPALVSVEQILDRPQDFAGRRWRLAGRLDACLDDACFLCPESKDKVSTAGRCLATDIQGENRFASLVLSADFDPACLKAGSCLDHPVVLKNAKLEEIRKNRASAEGLWLGRPTPLYPLTGRVAQQMAQAADQAGFSKWGKMKAFYGGGKMIVCQSPVPFPDDSVETWPETVEAALMATSRVDHFRCKEVREAGGRMTVQI
jgi:hypothetical protein